MQADDQLRTSWPEAAEDFERVHRVVSRCVRKTCPRELESYVDDIVQGVMTRLVTRMKEEGARLELSSSYLWVVAKHAVVDEIRRRQRRREETSSEVDDVPAAGYGDPSVAPRSERIVAGVRACLRDAPEDRRAALGLYLQGMQLPEVAQALRCDRKRADNLVYRGLAALRRCLSGKGLTP